MPTVIPTKPRWYSLDVKLERKFDRIVTLEELRRHEKGKLKNMIVLKRGNRLSITPVTQSQFEFITSLV
jgi:predicted RNA-binding protein with PUA-like domain